MPYIISNRSVTDGVSLSVIKSKLVYCSFIFVEVMGKSLMSCFLLTHENKKLSYRQGTARQLKSCQLPRNSAETTCTASPEQIEVMKLEG